jgi:hypothetical protein
MKSIRKQHSEVSRLIIYSYIMVLSGTHFLVHRAVSRIDDAQNSYNKSGLLPTTVFSTINTVCSKTSNSNESWSVLGLL